MKELIIVNENDEIQGYGEKIALHKAAVLHRAFSVFIYDSSRQKMLIQQRAAGKYHSGGKWSNACCSHPYRGESWEDALSRCMKDELSIHAPLLPGKGIYQTARAEDLKDSCIGPVPVAEFSAAGAGIAAAGAEVTAAGAGITCHKGADAGMTFPVFSADPAHILFTGRFHYLSRYSDLSEHEMDHVFLYCPDSEVLSKLQPDSKEISAIRWVEIAELDQWLAASPEQFSSWFMPAYQFVRPLFSLRAE